MEVSKLLVVALASKCLINSSSAIAVAFYHLIHNHRIKTKILTTHLVSRNSGLSSSQYYRLMFVSMASGIWAVGWISLQLNVDIRIRNHSLPDWRTLHKGDSTVIKEPLDFFSPAGLASYRLFWWGIPGGAYIFFLFFGTNSDAYLEYIKLWNWFRKAVLRRPLPEMVSTLRSK
jgi:Pheromone A receptor